MEKWGIENDYSDMYSDFGAFQRIFIDKGIPLIIVETGVITRENKESESIREYLFFLFSLSFSYNGMISCLWDTSTADFNYYDI